MLITLTNTTFAYDARPIVHVDHLTIAPAEILGVFGHNGSGKTTLVRGLTGLLSPMRGTVHGRDNLRIAYLPQQSTMESHWPMSGFDAAALIVSSGKPFGRIRRDRDAIRETLRSMGILHLAPRPFFSLSGGQRQRLLLAGALAERPDLLVLDEPTNGLDVQSRDLLLETLSQFVARGCSAVMISHDIEDLSALCRRIAWVRDAAEPNEPNRVELVSPSQLSTQLTTTRRGA
jgi:ABC-type Mn2+/Zn2+ transport system ATPase subunit